MGNTKINNKKYEDKQSIKNTKINKEKSPALHTYNLYALLQVNSGKERESQRLYSRKSDLFQKGVLGS